jgi:uncharacterized delta-60 repeat protein
LRRFVLALALAVSTAATLVTVASAVPGDLDSSFSGNGKLVTNVSPGYEYAEGVAIQADGKIVAVGGAAGKRNYQFALVRYNGDGTRDASFGGDGIVTTPFLGGSFAQDVAIQPDGKIVVAGQNAGASRFILVRYDADGTLDPTFGGGDGKVTTAFAPSDYESASAVAILAGGKIVVAGSALERFAIARYNIDGTLDPSFSGDGKQTTDFFRDSDFDEGAEAVAIQADGKIVAGGWGGIDVRYALARYNPDGTLDSTFGANGKVVTNLTTHNDYLLDLALQADGKIIAAGNNAFRFALLRYNQDGTLDPTFSGNGKVFTNFARRGGDGATGVVIQPDGRIVAAGLSAGKFAVARYNPDGGLDFSFSADGKLTTNFTTRFDGALDVALQGDGKIVAAGIAHGGRRFALARYLGG